MNVMATMSDKASKKDFVIVEQLPAGNSAEESQSTEQEAVIEEKVEPIEEKPLVEGQEESRAIAGYEGLYEMTTSGRIITVRENRPLARCNDEYGFHIARLTKDGKASSHNVFELWKQTFPELEHTLSKGLKSQVWYRL